MERENNTMLLPVVLRNCLRLPLSHDRGLIAMGSVAMIWLLLSASPRLAPVPSFRALAIHSPNSVTSIISICCDIRSSKHSIERRVVYRRNYESRRSIDSPRTLLVAPYQVHVACTKRFVAILPLYPLPLLFL